MRDNNMRSSKLKKHLPIFLFFIPSSLLALLLLHLAGYSLRVLCVRPVIAPFVAITEEIPHQKFRLLQDSTPKQIISPFIPKAAKRMPRRARRKKPNALLGLLQHASRFTHFSARAASFFHACDDLRFFMTWISGADSFGPRELLSVQSLFKSHPNSCLLIVSNALDSPTGAKTLQPFVDRGFKIAALSPNFDFLFKNTPAEHWFANLSRGAINPGEVSLGQNLSNLLRLALLYKFGGIYIDTDVIILKSLYHLSNVIGAQTVDVATGNWSRLNNAVMIFDKGHPLLHEFMEEFARTFDGNRWGHNGPYLVSRVVRRVTGLEFTVLPPPAFYPVDWTKIEGLFQGPRGGSHSKWVTAKFGKIMRESFALHLWNRRSRGLEVEEGSVVGRVMMGCCILCNFSNSNEGEQRR